MTTLPYALITPARNEASHIENTIRSVIGQTVLPRRWVIVSDGSTDGTDDIVRDHASRHDWIRYVRRPDHGGRHFAGKALAFEAGRAELGTTPYEIIGNLDADLSFGPDVMAYLLEKFSEDPDLGVAGVPFLEAGRRPYDFRFTNIEHVSGACQLFRRRCFEAVGGYRALEGGGIDWLAVTTARMLGWKTQTFTERSVSHLREIGTEKSGRLGFLFRQGVKEHRLGSHPVWQFVRAVYQMRNRPYVIGGAAILLGYVTSFVRGDKKQAPPEVVRFCRREQMGRLLSVARKTRHRRNRLTLRGEE